MKYAGGSSSKQFRKELIEIGKLEIKILINFELPTEALSLLKGLGCGLIIKRKIRALAKK